jgi:hypothetical protein
LLEKGAARLGQDQGANVAFGAAVLEQEAEHGENQQADNRLRPNATRLAWPYRDFIHSADNRPHAPDRHDALELAAKLLFHVAGSGQALHGVLDDAT